MTSPALMPMPKPGSMPRRGLPLPGLAAGSRRAKPPHHPVTRDMKHCPAVLARDLRKHGEILIEERDDVGGREPLGNRREAAHVREQHGAGQPRSAAAL